MPITGRRIVLRDDARPGDAEDLFRWLNLEEWNYYDEPDAPFVPVSWEEFERRHSRPRKPVRGAHTWHVDTLGGRHLGWVNYYGLDEAQGCALVGVAFPEPETWGQGYATEALRLLIDYLFREMGLSEVRTQTWTGNRRMRRVAEKCSILGSRAYLPSSTGMPGVPSKTSLATAPSTSSRSNRPALP